MKALSLQKYASVAALIALYGIGLPLALHWGFTKELGVKGFWLGYFVALVIQDFTIAGFVVTADWTPKVLQADVIIKRVFTF